jgi:hypothetical protein
MVLSFAFKARHTPHDLILSIDQNEIKLIRPNNRMIAVLRNFAIVYGTKPRQISSGSAFVFEARVSSAYFSA